MIDKSEKYLKSIDNTLSDILKELKRQGRLNEASIAITPHGKKVAEAVSKLNSKAEFMNGARSMTSEYL